LNFETVITWINTPIINIGQTPLSLGNLGTEIVVVFASFFASNLVQRVIGFHLQKTDKISHGVAYAIQRVVHYLIIIFGVFLSTQIIGLNLGSIAVLFGFLGVGIGLGLQNLTSNFVAGLLILIERPISIGDFVEVGGQIGKVTSINIRTTFVQTLDNVTVIVPNSKLIDENVTNWSILDRKVRIHCPIGVEYGSDVQKVKDILLEIADSHPKVLKTPAPEVWFEEFADSSLNFKLLIWIGRAEEEKPIRSDINFAIDEEFRKGNITIPFPQRDINLKVTPALEKFSRM